MMFLEEKKIATFQQVQDFDLISFFFFFLRCSHQLICHIVVFKDELRMLWKEFGTEKLQEDLG